MSGSLAALWLPGWEVKGWRQVYWTFSPSPLSKCHPGTINAGFAGDASCGGLRARRRRRHWWTQQPLRHPWSFQRETPLRGVLTSCFWKSYRILMHSRLLGKMVSFSFLQDLSLQVVFKILIHTPQRMPRIILVAKNIKIRPQFLLDQNATTEYVEN